VIQRGDIRESPFEGGAPNAGGYIDLSYSAGLDPSGGSATPPPPRASSSRLNRAISASYLPSVSSVLIITKTKKQKLTLHEFSGEPSLAHIMIDGLIQVPVLAVVLPINLGPLLKRQDRRTLGLVLIPLFLPYIPILGSNLKFASDKIKEFSKS
jgi:hypothetical protein